MLTCGPPVPTQTAEVPITNLHAGNILDESKLPISYVAFTPCFRAEAGSAGRDTRGLFRQHQFHKVELVKVQRKCMRMRVCAEPMTMLKHMTMPTQYLHGQILHRHILMSRPCPVHVTVQLCTPEQADEQHHMLVSHAEACLKALKLPYRKMRLCSGDIGFSARLCYDLEVWLPGQVPSDDHVHAHGNACLSMRACATDGFVGRGFPVCPYVLLLAFSHRVPLIEGSRLLEANLEANLETPRGQSTLLPRPPPPRTAGQVS